MQAQDAAEAPKEDSKSLSEWPTLGEVHMNEKQASSSGSSSLARNSKEQSPSDNVDDDSAKENQESSKPVPSLARRKGSKQKWVPLDVETGKNDKRKPRNGRNYAPKEDGYSSDRRKNDEVKKGDNRKDRSGNQRPRGKKGRGFTGDWKSKRRDDGYYQDANGYVPADVTTYYSYYPCYWNGYTPSEEVIKDSIKKQVEYYFSEENLQKDFFMRRRMNNEGYIPVALIAGFHRVTALSPDVNKVIDAMNVSDQLEVKEDPEMGPVVRTINNPEQWPIFDALSAEIHNELPAKFATGDASDNQENGNETSKSPLPKNGNRKEPRWKSRTKSSSAMKDIKEENVKVSETDELEFKFDEELSNETFDDAQASKNKTAEKPDNDISDQDVNKLIIVTQVSGVRKHDRGKMPNFPSYVMSQEMASTINDGLHYYEQDLMGRFQTDLGYQGAGLYFGSMPLSPGMHVPVAEAQMSAKWSFPSSPSASRFYPVVRNYPTESARQRFQKIRSNSDAMGQHVGWVMDIKEHPSRSRTNSASESVMSPSSYGSTQQLLPAFEHPSHALLKENGFTQVAYSKYRNRCIKDRNMLGIGQSQEMNTLFRFWSFFLRDRFNRRMYNEFRKFAIEDANLHYRYRYGLECLFRFYSYGLEKHFREDLFEDFQNETLKDLQNGYLYGLEKFWAFLEYSGKKDSLKVDPVLKATLQRFKSVEDFRAYECSFATGPTVERHRNLSESSGSRQNKNFESRSRRNTISASDTMRRRKGSGSKNDQRKNPSHVKQPASTEAMKSDAAAGALSEKNKNQGDNTVSSNSLPSKSDSFLSNAENKSKSCVITNGTDSSDSVSGSENASNVGNKVDNSMISNMEVGSDQSSSDSQEAPKPKSLKKCEEDSANAVSDDESGSSAENVPKCESNQCSEFQTPTIIDTNETSCDDASTSSKKPDAPEIDTQLEPSKTDTE